MRNANHLILAVILLATSLSRAATLSLQSGASITIDGSGTTGTIGGLPFNNGTSRYEGGSADQNGVLQVTAIQLNGNANLNIGSGAEVTGGLATNGAIAINSRSSGTIRITGGSILGGPADRSSGAALSLGGTGPVFISGGDLIGGASGLGLETSGSGPVWITGGRFSTSPFPGGTSIFATRFFNTTTNQAEPGGVVNILGGQIESSVSGLRWGLGVNPLGTIALFSKDQTPFLVNGVPMNHTTIPLMPGTNTISGTLYNGDVLDTTFYNNFSGFGAGGSIRLNVGAIPTDYVYWGAAYGLTAGTENADSDGDGLSNFQEYAFGLIPNSGASVNPVSVGLNKTTKKFSYTRRATPATTGLGYTVWFSTDLAIWTQDTGATAGTPVLNGGVETVEVTLSTLPGDPLPAKLFIRVKALKP